MTTIILSGGAGTRLWPLSRQAFPKQFCDLLGGPSLFERTVARNAPFSERFLVVTNKAHYETAAEQFQRAAPKGIRGDFILEPCGRNTAPAIALACLGIQAEEIVLVVASDHVILDELAYAEAVARARTAAEEGYLVTFGLRPEYPETGYGYIEAEPGEAGHFRKVKSFKEKPDRATAEAYIAEGRYYWNSGMFCFRAGVFLAELGRSSPSILAASKAALGRAGMREGFQGSSVLEIEDTAMRAIPADSIDFAVMEKSEVVATVPCSIGWSDLGSWDSVYETRRKDLNGSAAGPELIAVDARNNLVISSGRHIALVGVDDLIVVDTRDAVLVTRRGSSQDVKKVVDVLKASGEHGLL